MVKTTIAILLLSAIVAAQGTVEVSGHVNVVHPAKSRSDSSGVVVYLTPTDPGAPVDPFTNVTLQQKNKRFEPHLLVIPVGTEVQFPNQDPFFHNVFSIYEGKRFDLGLYEAGTSRKVRFSRPGASYIFCNIHPEMTAIVLSLPTTHFAISEANGDFKIEKVPEGNYVLGVWYEYADTEELAKYAKTITIREGELALQLTIRAKLKTAKHQNKYGQDYDSNPHPYQP